MSYVGNAPVAGIIDGSNILDGGVQTADIANGAITPAKLSTGGPSWDSSSNVGVGLSSPQRKLHILGADGSIGSFPSNIGPRTCLIVENNHNSSIGLLTATGAFSGGIFAQAAGTNATYGAITFFHNSGSPYARIETAGTERMRIDASGNVGIGTSSPNSKLYVAGTNPYVYAGDGNSPGSSDKLVGIGYSTTNDYGDIFAFQNGVGAKNIVLQRLGGRVGIGTTSPSQLLELNSASSPAILVKDTRNNIAAYIYADNNAAYMGSATAHAAIFKTTDVERIRIAPNSATLIFAGGNANATGTGITFPATQSESSDANTLDDYEEGTFSPTISGWSGTYATQTGWYTKVGRLVTVYGRVITNASTGSFSSFPSPSNYPFVGFSVTGAAIVGHWAVVQGAQNLGTNIIAAGPLDGPWNGAVGGFPNVYIAGGTTNNWGASYLNAASAVEYRFTSSYFTN